MDARQVRLVAVYNEWLVFSMSMMQMACETGIADCCLINKSGAATP